jgi:hypothetical protein
MESHAEAGASEVGVIRDERGGDWSLGKVSVKRFRVPANSLGSGLLPKAAGVIEDTSGRRRVSLGCLVEGRRRFERDDVAQLRNA